MTDAPTTSDPEARNKLRSLIKDARIAMLATQGSDGAWHARPMGTSATEFDGSVWFLTDASSGKIEDIEASPQVLVTYADESHQHYVSAWGRAAVVRDKAKIADLWSEAARVWFPKGKDDPSIAAICVEIETAEYWDAPSSTMVYAYGYAKAVLTGERPKNVGEVKRVAFR